MELKTLGGKITVFALVVMILASIGLFFLLGNGFFIGGNFSGMGGLVFLFVYLLVWGVAIGLPFFLIVGFASIVDHVAQIRENTQILAAEASTRMASNRRPPAAQHATPAPMPAQPVHTQQPAYPQQPAPSPSPYTAPQSAPLQYTAADLGKTANLQAELQYALQFTTDFGIRNYLDTNRSKFPPEEQAVIDWILSVPQHEIRSAIDSYLSGSSR